MVSLEPEKEDLSKRALEILRLLADRLSDREIADRLVLTINTVKWYNRQIYSILGVGGRRQAIARAHELGLLDHGTVADQSYKLAPHPKINLPVETTHFIGRRHEVQKIKRLLETAHVLTLVGPPGTGKTRLALRAARELGDAFRDGVYFVSLAPINDPALVLNTIFNVIGMDETRDQSLAETLKYVLGKSQMLLVLDNFEHVIPAAMQVSELLAAAPDIKVLVTSREPLHLYGEQQYAVPPLAIPDLGQLAPETLSECESTALFIQQARAVRPDFELTLENARDVAQICIRLEGLPLAIELAAVRMKMLTSQVLLARLSSRLDTLTVGPQDLPARHQTLHDTIEWSYNLLTEGEKRLFSRLAAFRGGCSLEAVEAVCSEGPPMDEFDRLESLVNKSLIQHIEMPGGSSRFIMLETLHEYAWKRLEASRETEKMHRRHAEYFVHLVERAEPELRQAGHSFWMDRLGSEENNLYGALEWSLGDGDVELGLRLVASLRDFWVMSGRFTQGQNWTQRALTKSGFVSPHLQVRVFIAAAGVLYVTSQQALQRQLLEEAVRLARAVDDRLDLAWALVFLAMVCFRQRTSDEEVLSFSEEALSIFRELGHKPGIVQALNVIGELWRKNGDDERAQAVTEECLMLVSETGEARREAMLLFNLGHIAMHRADIRGAEKFFGTGLTRSVEAGHDKRLILTGIVLLAGAIGANGESERAARLFGAAETLFEPKGVGLSPVSQPEYERALAFVRDQLGETRFLACWNEGRGMSLEQAVTSALEPGDS